MSDRLRVRSADQVAPERVRWLVPDRIPEVGVSLIVGDPGLGKSQYTILLAAQASRGELDRERPFCFMVTGEDALAPVVVPRLQAAQAIDSNVAFLEPSDLGEAPLTLPDDADALERKIAHYGPCLLVIDPLAAFLSEQINSWRDQSIRRALRPLHEIAELHRCAIVVVCHLNKAMGADPLYRTGGSVGIPAAARSALLLARDPDDPEGERGSRRVLAHFKSNYGVLAPSLSYAIEPILLPGDEQIKTSRLREVGGSDHGAHALLVQPQGGERTERDEAIDFLRAELADGPRPAREIKSAATDAGLSWRTIERAKADLGIEARRVGGAAGAGRWEWSLTPPAVTPPPLYPISGGLSENGSSKPNANGPDPKGAADSDMAEQARIEQLLSVPMDDDEGGQP